MSVDWQTAVTVGLVVVAITYLAVRAARFLRNAARGKSSACGGCAGSCASSAGQELPLIQLDAVSVHPKRPR